MVVWGILAAFMGLKGIQYVAKVATYLPLIPLVVLLWLTGLDHRPRRRLRSRQAGHRTTRPLPPAARP